MRFCSPVCVAAYQHRLEGKTKLKIEHLAFPTAVRPRKAGLHRLYDFVRQSPAQIIQPGYTQK
jgi:hypothetical protein